MSDRDESRRPDPELAPAIGRRGVVVGGLALPLSPAAAGPVLADTVSSLVARAESANAAFIRGDMTSWHRLAGPIAADFTLFQPFGGAATHGFDASPEKLAAMSRTFADGRGHLDLVASYATPGLVVLVFVERQRGRVGGMAEQDWSLRVTQVYRECGARWELVHRHADPLVTHNSLATTAALARGEAAARSSKS